MKIAKLILRCGMLAIVLLFPSHSSAQINTDQVMNIGRNALYFEDYVLSIQYFNQVIKAKPYLAEPYFYRAIAKFSLEDFMGAEEDCSLAIERNPFITDAYQLRGISRQTLKKNREAIADYTKGLELLPEHKTFLINKAVAEETIKDYDAAAKTYDRLIELYPNFENAYLGRTQLYLSKGDTIKALEDIDRSIKLGKNNANAYALRADIKMKVKKDYKLALADMDEAIKLEPHFAGYFINRAFLKYHLDDYFGAMSDYDYAIGLEPNNITARFNRGLLLAEVKENNKAIDDFGFVIKEEPENIMARYNRAELYSKTGQYKNAIKDYDVVLNKYPDFDGGFYARSECKRAIGDMAGGEHDYNKSRALYKEKRKFAEYDPNEDKAEQNAKNSESAVTNKFKNLLTIENDNRVKPEYDSKVRGKVQDNNVKIDPEPMFVLSYYDVVSELKDNSNYTRELTEINDARLLPFTLVLSNKEMRLYEDQIKKHFGSIEYYTGTMATDKPRSIDYFARAIDFMMVKNYVAAIADLGKAIKQSPKFTLAYFAHANAQYMQIVSDELKADYSSEKMTGTTSDALLKNKLMNSRLASIIADLDKVIELSPKMIYAHYDKGNIYLQMQDNTSAISAYSKAISIKPDFGEAYYNRGLVYLRLGNKEKGIADLSKAGELGIIPSYSVLKRMNN